MVTRYERIKIIEKISKTLEKLMAKKMHFNQDLFLTEIMAETGASRRTAQEYLRTACLLTGYEYKEYKRRGDSKESSDGEALAA